jgi:AraC-like DNA-binding protein
MKMSQKNLPSSIHATVRVGPLMSIPDILREYGSDPNPVLANFGFEPGHFKNPDYELPFVTTSRLIERCVEITGCDHLGLLIGMRAEPSSLGIAGLMLRTAPDVRTALQALLRHLSLHDTGGTPSVATKGEISSLSYVVHVPGVSAINQIYDLSMAMGCNLMRSLCGKDWNPDKVLIARPVPDDKAPYRQFFRSPVRFNTTESALIFPASWLDHKLPSEDPLLFKYFENRAKELHQSRNGDLINILHQFVRNTLITQECTACAAARHVGIHERTLNRRLREHGTTFRDEVNQVRYTMARGFLASTHASCAEIALAVGYNDATAFNHAFKRWSGMSPAQWRKQNND